MRRDKIVEQVLKTNGFQLLRNKSHNVYIHAECNQRLVTAKTSSDIRSIKNVIREIKKYFDINDLGVPAL
jgi:predicted RNA binding protein YcfA (HicA-like mRNA interferase family)